MAVKPIGSSLVSRAPGTITRKLEEQNIAKPPIPGKGEVGNVQRGLVQETDIQSVPGSNKVVRVAPGIESASQNLPGIGNPNTNILPGSVGQSIPAGQGSQPGAPTPALFSSVSPNAPASAGAATKGGAAPKVLGVSTTNTAPIKAAGVSGAPSFDYARQGLFTGSPELPSVLSVGSRVSAGGGEGNQVSNPQPGQQRIGNTVNFTPTTGQYLSGAAGKVVENLGKAINSQSITQAGQKMQTYGGAASPAATGQGSLTNVLRSIAQAVSNPVNQLRSSLSKLKFW